MPSLTLRQKLTFAWDWEWCLLTQMIVGATLSTQLHHVEDLIFHRTVVLITNVAMEIISLGFGTLTWFSLSVTHDS